MAFGVLISVIIAWIGAVVSVYCCRQVAQKARIGPLPTVRSMHQDFIPLLGGVGIFLGISGGLLASLFSGLMPIQTILDHQFFFLGWVLIFFTGLLDDLRSLPFWIKFILQLIAALALVFNGCIIEAFMAPPDETFSLGAVSIPFTLLWIVFVVNAVNLLDGLDGLAGGVSVIAFIGFAIIAALQGSPFLLLLALVSSAAILGFLKFNRYPASIFMGDAGSLQLGYLLAFLSIEAFRVAGSHHVLFLSAIVLLGLPLTDTLIAFFRRLTQGKSPFHPDKQHVHHRLLDLGISHPATVRLLYLIQFMLTTLAILMVIYRDQTVYLLFALFLLLAFYWMKRLGYLETYQRFSRVSLGEQNPKAASQSNSPSSLLPATRVTVPLNLNRLWHQVLLFGGDLIAIVSSIVIIFWIRTSFGFPASTFVRHVGELFQYPVMVYAVLLWTLLFWLNGLYDMGWDVSRYEHITRLLRVITFGIVVLGLITSDLHLPTSGRQWMSLGGYWLVFSTLTSAMRLSIIALEKQFKILEYAPKPTIFIGFSPRLAEFLTDIQNNPHLLYDVKGIVSVSRTSTSLPLPVLGNLNQLPSIIVQHSIQEAIIDLPEQLSSRWLQAIAICDRLNVTIRTFPGIAHIFSGGGHSYSSYAVITLLPNPMVQWQWLIKRTLDVLLSLVALVALTPLLILWWMIQTWQQHSLLHSCAVVGKFGVEFPMFYLQLPQISGLCTKPRLEKPAHRFQYWLFKTRLYKLPQIFNVLRGEMSWVGPRPEPREWYQQVEKKLPFVYRRLFVRPGITGLGQMRYRYEHSQKAMEARIRSDIFYIENMSIRMDFQILLRSVWLFFFERKPGRRA